jgi:hypothetical protein
MRQDVRPVQNSRKRFQERRLTSNDKAAASSGVPVLISN